MSTAQRIIKYFAISLAVFLIVNIVLVCFSVIASFSIGFDSVKENQKTEITSLNDLNITTLDIDLKASNLIIQIGEEAKVETNNQYVEVSQKNSTLFLEEKKHSIFSKAGKNKEVLITIPEEVHLENIEIDAGAGVVEIENLKSKKLSLDLGAGKVTIKIYKLLKK